MIRLVDLTPLGVHGFAGGTTDLGANGENLPKGTYHNKTIVHGSWATDVDTDDSYKFNETTQTWRKQA